MAAEFKNNRAERAYRINMSQDRRKNSVPDTGKGKGAQRPTVPKTAESGTREERMEKIEKTERVAKRLRIRSLVAFALAAVLLAGVFAGGSAASANEQAIRLALGQKNYVAEGEEGPQYFDAAYKDPAELREDCAVMGRDIAREGIVLLRNESDVLPLRKGAAVSVFGKAAVRPVLSSTADVKGAQSFREALEEEKIRVNDKLWEFTNRGGGNSFSKKVEKSLENFSEAAIVVIGRSGSDTDLNEPAYREEEAGTEEADAKAAGTGGEAEKADAKDEKADAKDEKADAAAEQTQGEAEITGAKALQLTAEERELLAYVRERFESVIVVLNTENPMETGFLDEFGVSACLWTGALGRDGLTALAEVISGKVNPSGRLPDTFVYNSFSAPASANLGDYTVKNSKEEYGSSYLVYEEGIYVGYRYYETRYEDTVLGTNSKSAFDYEKEVAYPFGYGLSYTTFELKNMKMTPGKKGYDFTVDVYNTGDREGREVVQLYVQKPYGKYCLKVGMEVPSVELAGFTKTGTIQPGEHVRVKFNIGEEALRSFDADGRGTYIYDSGTYMVTAAQNAHAAVNNILTYKGKAKSDLMSGTGDGGLVEVIECPQRDYKIFSVSAETGETIHRRFKSANPAQYDSGYHNLSRNLWKSTWPQTWNGGTFSAPSSFLEQLQVSSGEDNNAPAPVYNTAHGEKNTTLADMRDIAFDDYRWGAMLDQLTWKETYSLVRKGGGLVNEVLSCAAPQALISGDEAGILAKYGDGRGYIYPSATVLAATWDTELITRAAQLIGEEALQAGVTFWKMPSLNLHRTAMGGRNCDSFSEDSYLTGKMAAALCKGVSEKGVVPVLGRLVLADQETGGTGLIVMAGEQAIRELYLRPFEIALRDTGSGRKAVMTGMNRIGARWCGGCGNLLTGVLRTEWGFNGIVMTDSVTRETAGYADILEGLEAGTDLWQNTSDNNYKLRGGQLTYGVRARFRKAAERILQTISRSNAMNGIGTNTTLRYSRPAWRIVRAVLGGIAVIIGFLSLWYALAQWRRERRLARKLAALKRERKREKYMKNPSK